MLNALILFADAADDVTKPEGPGLVGSLLPILMIVAVFYFLIIMPGRKERQQRQAMMGALKRNDKVITNGGIIGVVTNIKEGTDEVTIRSEDTKLLILRSSIARIVTEAEKDSSSTQIKPAT
jgi:preprotein translocase subunit YajC